MSIDPFLRKGHRRRQPESKASAPQSTRSGHKRYWIGGGFVLLLLLLIVFFPSEKTLPSSPSLTAPAQGPSEPAPDIRKAAEQSAANAVRQASGRLVTVAVDPATAVPGDRLQAVVHSEYGKLEGEIDFQWYRNDMPINEAVGSELDTAGFVRNDSISVVATRRKGSEKESKQSLPVRLRNRPPVIEIGDFGKVVEGHYVHEVKATDPDGDSINFSLAQAPPDMMIDAATGIITWPLPFGVEGEFELQIVASDGTSATLRQMKITLGGSP